MNSNSLLNDKTALLSLKSLEERSISSDEFGTYWERSDYSWDSDKIATQTTLIEFYKLMGKNTDQLTKYLIVNKRSNKWSNTKSTTEAIYSLLKKCIRTN